MPELDGLSDACMYDTHIGVELRTCKDPGCTCMCHPAPMPDAMLPDPGWSCDRCGRPVAQTADSKWAHAELVDALFCSLVMRASERVANSERMRQEAGDA